MNYLSIDKIKNIFHIKYFHLFDPVNLDQAFCADCCSNIFKINKIVNYDSYDPFLEMLRKIDNLPKVPMYKVFGYCYFCKLTVSAVVSSEKECFTFAKTISI